MDQPEHNRPQLLDTVEGTAFRLGVGKTTIFALIRTGKLNAVKIGRATRIPVASAEAFVQRLQAGN